MQYLSWASYQIPLAFVRGLSMRKTAKTVEHAGGFVSARGFEGAEISAQIEVDRAKCLALGLDFNQWHGFFENLEVDTDGASGSVTLGGYSLYPELLFAATNKNMTQLTDLVSAALVVSFLAVLGTQEHRHANALRAAQEDLAKLGEITKAQEAQLAQASALLRARNAESTAASKLCLRIEEIRGTTDESKEAIHETTKNDDASALWHESNIPSALLDALSGLRGTQNTDHN